MHPLARLSSNFVAGAALLLFPLNIAFAYGDLEIKADNLTLSDSTIVHLQTVKLYATVINNSKNDLLGSVQFKNTTTGNAIGSDQPISVLAHSTDSVFVEWKPSAGTYDVIATVIPWDTAGDDPNNNTAHHTVIVDYDFDNDGIGNALDTDDDNDGTPDLEDAFPLDPTESLDTDGDGQGDNVDTDDDNDSTLDSDDQLPLDPTEILDTDEDGLGDNIDTDDDNDGLSDEEEIGTGEINSTNGNQIKKTTGTNPKKEDTDGDGVLDGKDTFPTDKTEWVDTDGDGLGNNLDKDDENDGLVDTQDEFPLNKGPVVVLKQYEEKDPLKISERFSIWDASLSYDPDGNLVAYRWFSRDGRLLGEEAVLKVKMGDASFLPASLMIFDNQGESRTLDLTKNAVKYFGAMGLALLITLLIALALILYLKYSTTASKKEKDKPVKQVKH